MERKLTAILSADIKGYSRLMGEDEVGTLQRLTAYREVTDALIQHLRGRIVGTAGDSILAEFASAVEALQCAVDIQQALKIKNAELPPEKRMEFRIGINVGDVIAEGLQIYGDGVNIAARLESLAEPGGICISGTVYDHVENKLALIYESQGEQMVKNIAKPVRVYRVVMDSEAAHRSGGVPLHSPSPGGQSPEGTPPIAQLALPDKPSIAVLPFVNRSGDAEQEHFSDGMTDTLITDLCTISGLFVIARTSVFTYKGKAAKVETVSKELGVRYVVEGSVQKAGDRVRINTQLIDATTGGQVWAERYDRELQDIFALQDEISQKIVQALEVELTQEEQARLTRKETSNIEAYEAFWRGEAAVWRFTKKANLQAQRLYERAIELDPEYAAAYAGLAQTYILAVTYGWSRDPQLLRRAVELAEHALALDASLPTAHHALSTTDMFKGQHDQAITHLEHSIALAPNDAYGYVCLGHTLSYAGRHQEAITVLHQGLRLSPHYPVGYLFILGQAYAFAGQYAEAETTLKKVLARSPDFWSPYLWLAIIYMEGDRHTEAQAAVAEVRRTNPQFSLKVLAEEKVLYKDPAVLERMIAALRKAGLN